MVPLANKNHFPRKRYRLHSHGRKGTALKEARPEMALLPMAARHRKNADAHSPPKCGKHIQPHPNSNPARTNSPGPSTDPS